MCLFMKSVPNPVLRTLAKGGFSLDAAKMLPSHISVPCGKCVECRKKYANDWRFRLYREMDLGRHRSVRFVTLTLSPEYYENNPLHAREYIRRFLDRFRKVYHRPLRHWFCCEYGSSPDGTHRLHFHGLIFDFPGDSTENLPVGPNGLYFRRANAAAFAKRLTPLWKYGIVHVGDHADLDTAIYITKYITKGWTEYLVNSSYWIEPPRVFASAGIGVDFLNVVDSVFARRRLRRGRIFYSIGSCRYSLPRYYANKLLRPYDSVFRQFSSDYIFSLDPPPYYLNGQAYYDPLVYARVRVEAIDRLKRLRLYPDFRPMALRVAESVEKFNHFKENRTIHGFRKHVHREARSDF